ncbi:hypothetical protein A3H90_02395, partial [Candidatus Peribacteria bacterium RIFCSPLOWO2_02_FULL_55_36]
MPFHSSTHSSPKHWLSLHVRLVIAGVLLFSVITPPYIPRETLAFHDEDAVQLPQFLLVEDGFLMKSSSLTEQGTRRAYAQGIIHTVIEGENLERIAERYGISVDTIRWVNKLEVNTPLKPGRELLILPVDGLLHIVATGQTLGKIADLYTVPAEEIASQNQLRGSFILAGQELIIPGGRPIITKPLQIAAKPPTNAPRGEPREPSMAPAVPAVAAQPTRGVLQMPCNSCLFTQYYNPGHYAVDLQTKGGGPVFAAEDGTVVRAEYGWNGGFGNVIEIDHGNGLFTLYAHNKELYVQKGERVARGKVISWMGNTGRVYGQTGIHVHFEVRVNGI